MNIQIKMILLVFLSLCLSCCMSVTNPPEYRMQINKVFHFDQIYFVAQTQGVFRGKIVFVPASDSNSVSSPPFPSLHEYLNKKAFWMEWHTWNEPRALSGITYRILGIVARNTLYRIERVTKHIESFSGGSCKDISIITGQFSGMKTTFCTDAQGRINNSIW